MDRKGPERARRRDDVSATRGAAHAQVRVDAWRGEGVQITCSATSVRWRAHRSVPTQHTTSAAGAEASLAARSTVALIAQKSQVAGASNRSPHVLGGHTHASTGPPTGRPTGRPGRAPRVEATGYASGLRSTLHRSCAPVADQSLSKQRFVGVCQIICPYVLTLLTRKMH